MYLCIILNCAGEIFHTVKAANAFVAAFLFIIAFLWKTVTCMIIKDKESKNGLNGRFPWATKH